MKYATHVSIRQTPQSEPIPGSKQVPNNAGGYAFPVDDWVRLHRFLILGTEKGTYYTSEHKLTRDNAEAVMRCIKADGLRVVAQTVEISQSGRAPKNDPALFVLALCASLGDTATRNQALANLAKVARTGTHLFTFCENVQALRGWGRSLREGVAGWYQQAPDRLVYQAIKYRQRNGWTHCDVLRLAHPKPADETHNAIFNWIVRGWPDIGPDPHPDAILRQVWAFERIQRATSVHEVIELLTAYHLPWECIPTQWLTEAKVWQVLLPTLPMTALLRNLGRMTANGVFTAMGPQTKFAVARLTDAEVLRKARVHPLQVLAALTIYSAGKGVKGSLTWEPLHKITDALDAAYYTAFENVQPTGKRLLLGLDVSGSMQNNVVVGMPFMPAYMASAAMALQIAREEDYVIMGFDTRCYAMDISVRQRLDDVMKRLQAIGGGGTDCALPMQYALDHRISVDAFIILTDSETWAGNKHPVQALYEYRQKMNIPAKLITVAMCANEFALADADDVGVLNVVGFDTTTPQLIVDFATDGQGYVVSEEE